MNRPRERQEMQSALRESISWWAGYQQSKGRNDSESYRLFYHVFGVDVMTAQALGKPDALALANKINNYLGSVR
jgi:DNA repair protein RadD